MSSSSEAVASDGGGECDKWNNAVVDGGEEGGVL